MIVSLDQLGRELVFDERPKRIISLVPSQSEFLWDLGLREELIGISKFCVHPTELFQSKERVGGTKSLNLKKIRALKPDLIIGNKEENTKEEIEELSKEFKVWMSDIYTFEDAFNMMDVLGELLNKKKEAKSIIKQAKKSLEKSKGMFKGKRAVYFIWNDPYLFAAKNTFIHEVMEHAGFKNLLANKSRYPELSVEELKKLKPDFCLLSSEPFPFKIKHAKVLQDILPGSKIVFVDGELFSWYGSRMIYLYDYLLTLKKQMHA